jgi:ribosomal protein L37AE/L43A
MEPSWRTCGDSGEDRADCVECADCYRTVSTRRATYRRGRWVCDECKREAAMAATEGDECI